MSIREIPTVLLKDGYKVGHVFQYPADTTQVYSNFTARKGRCGMEGIIFFGLQYFVQEYLMTQFNDTFFNKPKEEVVSLYQDTMDEYLGPGAVTSDHIAALHDLGYLPLKIKALPEGAWVPYGVPVLTITNTVDEFYWLPNMLETLMSNILWMGSTSATTAFEFRKTFEEYARLTVGDDMSFVPWQGHDFSMRGLPGIEAALISGGAHLTSFTGTDTIPAIAFLKEYYAAEGLIGGSVPATEHSVMSMGGQADEFETFKRLVTEVYPTGILSVVSDTWDLWKVLTDYLPRLKNEIMARDGKLVIRPDSGDPSDIVCGDPHTSDPARSKGVIELLWDVFGGTITKTGHKLLDSHVGVIYGDGITLERQRDILDRLHYNGYSSYNMVFGIGSFSYQNVTRDTHGFAMKATWGRTKSHPEGIDIFKDPVTDDGTKKSAKGRMYVGKRYNGNYYLDDEVSSLMESGGHLTTVFEDGKLKKFTTLDEIRERVNVNAWKETLLPA